jgi:2-polyprenyl-6-methoxyphenol hydroxylase-like FAD-dependent oxidoreductase
MSHVAIVGAGPAGATLAYLLARSGVEVTLLERHEDFRREFRGEVLMPSGLEPYQQMGLWDELESVPQVRFASALVYVNGQLRVRLPVDGADFEPFGIRWVSQPGLLEMLVEQAGRHPGFRLERGASVGALVEEHGRIVGVEARIGGVARELRADLVIGADGRGSVVRRRAELAVTEDPTPMDIVWCRMPMLPGIEEVPTLRLYVGGGHLLICAPTYDDRLQLGWVIRKGAYRHVKDAGIPACLDEMARQVSPDLAAHLRRHRDDAIDTFLLSTVSDRVREWTRPGLLVIGDAAHTMSPVGAQGINVAIRDAVVAANHLVPVLTKQGDGDALDAAARAVQAEREPEVRQIQRLQAIPPPVLLHDSWWSQAILAVLPRIAGSRLLAAPRRAGFRRFASGITDVRLSV